VIVNPSGREELKPTGQRGLEISLAALSIWAQLERKSALMNQ
jgi:hypothetical protein